jgi:hypothetical protein
MKKILLLLGKIVLVIMALIGVMLAGVGYVNWTAERKAKAFCDGIAMGSDISLVLEKAKTEKVFIDDSPPYNFYFFGFVFDKAVCEVSVDANRKVVSKVSEMEYD